MEFHEFVSNKLDGMYKRPRMYGTCNEVLEAEAILLLLCEVQHYCPEYNDPDPVSGPRWDVMDAYTRERSKRYPKLPTVVPLFVSLTDDSFHQALHEIIHKVRLEVGTALGIWGPEGKARHILEDPK